MQTCKAQLSAPLCSHMQKVSIQAKEKRRQILWVFLAVALGILCWGVTQRVRGAKHKRKAALW